MSCSPPNGNRLLRLAVRSHSRVLDGCRPSRERRLEFDLTPNRPDLPGPNHWSMVAHSHHPPCEFTTSVPRDVEPDKTTRASPPAPLWRLRQVRVPRP